MAKKPLNPKELRKEAQETARIVDDAMRTLSSRIVELFEQAAKETEDITKDLVKEVQKGTSALLSNADALIDAQEKANKGALKQRDIAKEIEKKQKAILTLEVKIAEAQANGAKNTEKMSAELEKVKKSAKEFEKSLNEAGNRSKQINKAMGLTGGALKGLKKLAGGIGLDNLENAFEDAENASTAMAQKITENGQKNIGVFGK